MELDKARREIDNIDEEIVKLLEKDLVCQIGLIKMAKSPVCDESRKTGS